MTRKIEATISVQALPPNLAAWFCELDAEEQAEFFDEVARISRDEWPKESFFGSSAGEAQWGYMRDYLSVRALATLISMSEVLWKSGDREYLRVEPA